MLGWKQQLTESKELVSEKLSLQRYGQGNALKRTIFELIAQEILRMAPDTPDPSNHSQTLTDSRPG